MSIYVLGNLDQYTPTAAGTWPSGQWWGANAYPKAGKEWGQNNDVMCRQIMSLNRELDEKNKHVQHLETELKQCQDQLFIHHGFWL